MNRKQFVGFAAALGLGLSLHLSAQAQSTLPTSLAGVKIEPEATVGGQKLQLNGAGVRIRAIFKVYVGALYTPSKATKNEDVLKLTPKRLQLTALRDVKGDDFGRLFSKGMEDNASKEEFAKSINGVIKVGQIFADAKNFAKGDVITLDYIPGTGTVISHKGKQMAEPIKEPEFNSLLMKIWFGSKPADDAFRKALLGEQTTANTNIN